MTDSVDLEELAKTCLATAQAIKTYFSANGLPQMTFDENGPLMFPPATAAIQHARTQLRIAAKTLYDLASGPDELVTWFPLAEVQDLNAFRYIYSFNVAAAVPINGEIAYSDLAETLKVDVSQLKQVLRQAMTARVFRESRPGYVAHTAPSRLLLIDGPRHFNGYVTEDCFPMAAKQAEALNKWGHGSQEPNQAAMNMAFDTKLQMFPFFSSEPARMERFAKLMQGVSKQDSHNSRHVVAGFDWASLGEATVVDIGGSTGHSSVAIAEVAPKIKCIVQDLPSMIEHAQDPTHTVVPPELQDRVSFMPHNFYDPQPVEADVYFLRLIMHDYPDKYCRKILQAIVSTMKPGSRLLIMDQVMPPVGVIPETHERIMRTLDMSMMMLSNAKERDMEEWTLLLKSADPRLTIKNVVLPPESVMSVIEVMLQSGPNGVVTNGVVPNGVVPNGDVANGIVGN